MFQHVLRLFCLAIVSAAAFASGDSPLKIESRFPGDLTLVHAEASTALSIQGRGIGSATLTCDPQQWPKPLILRVKLRGLESLTIDNGKVTWSASVQSHGAHETLLTLHEAGKADTSPDKDSPYWSKIQIYKSNDATALPGEDGWFELAIPAALLTGARELKISWVDFYR